MGGAYLKVFPFPAGRRDCGEQAAHRHPDVRVQVQGLGGGLHPGHVQKASGQDCLHL